jgi:MFS family permease
MLFLLPQHVQYVQDGSALTSGLLAAPFGLGLAVLSPLSGRLAEKYGPRVVMLARLRWSRAVCMAVLLLAAASAAFGLSSVTPAKR